MPLPLRDSRKCLDHRSILCLHECRQIAVPKRERHETRQLSTEEAYLEWKLALAAEPVVKAAEEAEKVYEELCEAESELNEENVDKLRLQYEKVADSWTNECTKWYDIYLDEMYPESDF